MSRINIEDIRKELEQKGWKLLSEEYKNLDSLLLMQCPKGHQPLISWKKARTKLECPICEKNSYTNSSLKVMPKSGKNRILSLDQATYNCGWSIFDDRNLIKYGIYHLSNDEEIVRINKLKNWFISMISNWKPDYIAIEGIQYQDEVAGKGKMGITVFQTLARLQGVLLDTCYDLKIPVEVCPTNTWRNHCGVKGRYRADKKKSMQLLAKEWYNVDLSDDEADAIGIGHYFSDKISKNSSIEDWE